MTVECLNYVDYKVDAGNGFKCLWLIDLLKSIRSSAGQIVSFPISGQSSDIEKHSLRVQSPPSSYGSKTVISYY